MTKQTHDPHRSRLLKGAPVAFVLALLLAACQGPSAADTRSPGQTADAMMRVADESRAHGDLSAAVTLYRRVHELNPTDPRPMGSLAATLMDMHAYTEAAETYRVAIGMNPNPNQGELYRGLAVVLLSLNQPEAALDTLQQALAKAPQDGRIYSAMGVTHDLMGKHDLAQQDYQNGIRLMPKSTGLRNNFGLSLALSGDYPAAIATLTELTLDAGASPRHRLNLALVYGLAGDDKKAASIARTTLDEKAVESNLAYYAMLRGMDDKARANAIMGGQLMGQVTVADHPGLHGGAEDVAKIEPAPREPVSTAALDAPEAVSQPMPPKPPLHKDAVVRPVAPMLAEAPADVVGGDMPAAAPSDSAAASPAPAPSEPTKLTKADSTPAADAPAPDQAATDQPTTPPASDQAAAAGQPQTPPADDQAAATDQPQTPPASEPAPVAPAQKRVASAATSGFSVQVGSFASEDNAKRLADQLNQKGYSLAVVHYRDGAGKDWYAVRAGGYGSADEAAAAARHMHDAEHMPAVVVHQRGSNQA